MLLPLLFALQTAVPEVVVQAGPGNSIDQVALSADDRYMAVNGWQSVVSLWDVERRLLIRQIGGFRSQSKRIAFSPKSNTPLSSKNGLHVAFG